jgi:hypothetical protein
MAEKRASIFTFHRIRQECELPGREPWRAFLDFYSSLLLRLLEIYLPENGARRRAIVEDLLRQLSAGNFQRFRQTSRQSEREFLVDLRALLFEIAAPAAGAASPANSALVSPDNVRPLLDGLPLLHQEMLFFKLAGYTDATLEQMLRVTPAVAAKAFERLGDNYAPVQNLQRDRCPWPAAWQALLAEARNSRQENCPELHQFLRIHDGQVSWYDKEPVERHVSACLHCLDRWTALREVGHWRRVAPPVPAATIDELLAVLPLAPPPPPSLLRRLFSSR